METHTHTHTHTHSHTHACTHAHINTHKHTRTHTHMRICTHTHTHTHMHTHTHTCPCSHLLCGLDGVVHLHRPQAFVHLVQPLLATPTSATPIHIKYHDVPAADQVGLPFDGILLRHLLSAWPTIPENGAVDCITLPLPQIV